YIPNTGNGPFPVILAIHGGAFKMGDKASGEITPMLEGLTRGYALVSINYRMSGEAKAPKLIQDVKAAIRWIRANAKQFKLNPDKIAAWGSSAGGHLSSLAGTSGGINELEDLSLGNPNQSSRVQAVVDWFGPINFLTMDDQFAMLGVKGMEHSTPNSPESEVIGKQIINAEAEVKAFSPATYITKDDPPFLVEHGSKDPLIPYLQSTVFVNQLYEVLGKNKVSFVLLEGEGHGGPQFSSKKNLEIVFAFLDKNLKN
ncbi:MAG: alpha/beta hydrolase fold domain-containing protein, partial [Chitinophagales bacterium]